MGAASITNYSTYGSGNAVDYYNKVAVFDIYEQKFIHTELKIQFKTVEKMQDSRHPKTTAAHEMGHTMGIGINISLVTKQTFFCPQNNLP